MYIVLIFYIVIKNCSPLGVGIASTLYYLQLSQDKFTTKLRVNLRIPAYYKYPGRETVTLVSI